jgi:hypothetical protein
MLTGARAEGGENVGMDEAAACWTELDDAWKEAFQQAWQALRTGNIASVPA